MAQDLPYREIGDKPSNFTAGTSISRMIDGLGYRYYWATDGLREEDLNYDPGNGGQVCRDVLIHIYGLSTTILNGAKSEANIRPLETEGMVWEDTRASTLHNLKQASDIMKNLSEEQINELKLIFKRGERSSEVDFWHMLNGPLSDAIYHVGQVVSYRRSAGNPIDSKVNVFNGKNRD